MNSQQSHSENPWTWLNSSLARTRSRRNSKKMLLVLVLVLGLRCSSSTPHHKKQQRKYDREWKSKRRQCLDNECRHMHPDENENCLNKCTSNACYHDVYGEGNGGDLEPGEVDHGRRKQYQKCVRAEIKRRVKERWHNARNANNL